MTTATWPASLPQYLEVDDFSAKAAKRGVRTAMDSGPGKGRPRFTAAPRPVKGSIVIDRVQYEILENFHDVVLGGGMLRFDWVHPITRAVATFRFTDEPDYRALGQSGAGLALLRATLSLELLP